MNTPDESLRSTGQTCPDTKMSQGFLPGFGASSEPLALTSFAAATPARKIAPQESIQEQAARRSAMSSSGLLLNFARALFSERIQHEPGPTLLGPGGDSEANLSEREKAKNRNGNGFGLTLGQWVALKLFTPVASDWRGSTGKGSRRNTLAEQLAEQLAENGKTVYPHPEFVEAVMLNGSADEF